MNLIYHCIQKSVIKNSELNNAAGMLLLALMTTVLASDTRADNQLHLETISHQSIVFTFNNKQTTAIPQRKTNTQRFFNSDQFSLQNQLAVENAPHLEFNYLWMRQNQDHYRYSDGGAAIGRLFRMGVKTWYKNYRNSNKNVGLPNENGGGSINTNIDYRLRLSSDRVKLALEYEF